MRYRVAFSCILAISFLGGSLASRAGSVLIQQSAAPDPYEPMEPMEDDPSVGGYKVRVGNGIPDRLQRRAFPIDAAGNLELAVQYQVKMPDKYGPGPELCRLVVQSARVPGCCGGDWNFYFEIPFEPFALLPGDHINDVKVVKIPPPLEDEDGAVRVVLEVLEKDNWVSYSCSTVRVMPQ